MSESECNERRRVAAMVGNFTSDKSRGAKMGTQVLGLLEEAGRAHNFDVTDITGTSFDDSLDQTREHTHEYDHLVVVGDDGMIALGASTVGCSGKPLSIAVTGSGNDFVRGLRLPADRIETAVEGIVGVIVRGSYVGVDMRRVASLDGSYAVDPSTGGEYEYQEDKSAEHLIDRYYAGVLSCGLDANINDHANHSHLPTGTMCCFAAMLVELMHMEHYGCYIKATLANRTTDERDIITPLLTIANPRHTGDDTEISSYSCSSGGLLDLMQMDRVPNFGECAMAISNTYNGKLLASEMFGQRRIRGIGITWATEGDEPPVLMVGGEYIGHLPFRVIAEDCTLRVLVPPAVATREADSQQEVLDAIARDDRDPVTGQFA